MWWFLNIIESFSQISWHNALKDVNVMKLMIKLNTYQNVVVYIKKPIFFA